MQGISSTVKRSGSVHGSVAPSTTDSYNYTPSRTTTPGYSTPARSGTGLRLPPATADALKSRRRSLGGSGSQPATPEAARQQLARRSSMSVADSLSVRRRSPVSFNPVLCPLLVRQQLASAARSLSMPCQLVCFQPLPRGSVMQGGPLADATNARLIPCSYPTLMKCVLVFCDHILPLQGGPLADATNASQPSRQPSGASWVQTRMAASPPSVAASTQSASKRTVPRRRFSCGAPSGRLDGLPAARPVRSSRVCEPRCFKTHISAHYGRQGASFDVTHAQLNVRSSSAGAAGPGRRRRRAGGEAPDAGGATRRAPQPRARRPRRRGPPRHAAARRRAAAALRGRRGGAAAVRVAAGRRRRAPRRRARRRRARRGQPRHASGAQRQLAGSAGGRDAAAVVARLPCAPAASTVVVVACFRSNPCVVKCSCRCPLPDLRLLLPRQDLIEQACGQHLIRTRTRATSKTQHRDRLGRLVAFDQEAAQTRTHAYGTHPTHDLSTVHVCMQTKWPWSTR